LGNQLKSLDSLTRSDRDRIRAENGKLTKDFMRVKLKFQRNVQATTQRIRDIDVGGGLASHPVNTGDQQRLQLQLQQEDIDEKILQEREEEILEINKKVVQVNAVFKDLAQIVNRQQEDIDHIETNIEESHKSAKAGLDQIEKAAKYQSGCVVS